MIVLCLEGCHGSGKTELKSAFSRNGYHVLDESFLEMPAFGLHPQSLMMETLWTYNWFSRVVKLQYDLNKDKTKRTIIISDRSPYSALFYCNNEKGSDILKLLINEQIKELEINSGIEILTAHINCKDDVLWSRIQDRLLLEPERKELNEDSIEWMYKVQSFYRNFNWDFVSLHYK